MAIRVARMAADILRQSRFGPGQIARRQLGHPCIELDLGRCARLLADRVEFAQGVLGALQGQQ